VKQLLRTLFDQWECAQLASVLAGTTGEGAALASDRLVGVGSKRHCGGEHER
jgi:hypothetical protein